MARMENGIRMTPAQRAEMAVWNKQLKSEGMPSELPPDRAAAALIEEMVGGEVFERMRAECQRYLAGREEEAHGSHDHMVRSLAKEFSLPGHEEHIEAVLRMAEEEIKGLNEAVRDMRGSAARSPRRALAELQDRFSYIDPEAVAIAFDRFIVPHDELREAA